MGPRRNAKACGAGTGWCGQAEKVNLKGVGNRDWGEEEGGKGGLSPKPSDEGIHLTVILGAGGGGERAMDKVCEGSRRGLCTGRKRGEGHL